MAYHSIVCVKQVPDTANITGEAMKDDGTVNRGALPAIFNPEDLHALEAALSLRNDHGGTVTAVCMGPPVAADVLRECLFRGADRCILISDRRAAASDTLATSYILAQAVKKVGKYDFVFCGRQAIDGDTAQVGPQMAEKLGHTQFTYFDRFEALEGDKVRVRRNIGNGWEIVEGKTPLVVTVLDSANVPRPAKARWVMQYKRARTPLELSRQVAESMPDATPEKQQAEVDKLAEDLRNKKLLIEVWDLDHVEADLQWCGLSGSPTKVHRIQSIVLTKEGFSAVEPTEEGICGMVHELIEDHTLG